MFCTGLRLNNNPKKTVLKYQLSTSVPCQEPSIYVYGHKMKAVKKFVYLGNTLKMTGTLADGVSLRMSKVSHAFGKLDKRLWSCHGVSLGTTIKVYNACVQSSLLYAFSVLNTFINYA